jgi:SAM-dependent methyltransferase
MMANVAAVSADVVTENLPATTYWDHVGRTTRWGRYLADLERKLILRGEALAQRGRAVDFGCGGGRWSKLLSGRGWQMSCMEVNPQALAICQRDLPSAKCFLINPADTSVPFGSNSANLALCIEVVPLIESDWFMAEAHRVLTDQGIFVGVYINGQSWRAKAWRLKQRLKPDAEGHQFYRASYPEWRSRFTAAGFEMLHEESCCWGPFSRSSNSPLVPVGAKLERALGLHRIVARGPWVMFIARKRSRR